MIFTMVQNIFMNNPLQQKICVFVSSVIYTEKNTNFHLGVSIKKYLKVHYIKFICSAMLVLARCHWKIRWKT
jgi:hypothetical protein